MSSAEGDVPLTAGGGSASGVASSDANAHATERAAGHHAGSADGQQNAHYAAAATAATTANQLLAMQQQQQQQVNALSPPQYTSNKSLVEHSKHAQQQQHQQQQQMQAADSGVATHHAPLHPPTGVPHYTALSVPGSAGSTTYSVSSSSPVTASPASAASPLTASPVELDGSGGYADAQVVPYPIDGSPQQHAYSKGYMQTQQQPHQLHAYQHAPHSHYLHQGVPSLQHSYAPAQQSRPGSVSGNNAAFTQVLVAGLPASMTQAELGEIFLHMPLYERCGIACDPATGVSIGRGWLVFGSAEAAQTAISQMSGLVIGGSTLHLSLMQPIGESTKSNIYVAGLPKQYTQAQLEHLFETFGTIIESKILTDPTGASRGVAFVRYDNSNSAAQAITAVNGHVLADAHHSYTIRVKFARDHHRNADPTLAMLTGQAPPNHNSGQHAPRPAAIYQSYIPPGVKGRAEELNGGVALFVFHIPAEFTSRDLQELFSPCATVLSARIAIHPQTLESKGFGFVSVATMEEAHQAVILLNGRRVGRKFIKVSFKKQTTPPTQTHQQMSLPQPEQLHVQHHQAQPQHGQHHTPLQQAQRAPSQSPSSLDINLSSLAAALSLSQGFQNLNAPTLNYAAPNAPGSSAWSPTAAASSSAPSPSLMNYNQNLPLHLLMQQMQLSQAFPTNNYNASPMPQTHSPQQTSMTPGGSSASSQPSQSPQTQQGGNSIYSFSPHSGAIGGNSQQQQMTGQQNWSPSSPLHLAQTAPQAYGGQYYSSQPQQQQQQQSQSQQQSQQPQQAQSSSSPAQQSQASAQQPPLYM